MYRTPLWKRKMSLLGTIEHGLNNEHPLSNLVSLVLLIIEQVPKEDQQRIRVQYVCT